MKSLFVIILFLANSLLCLAQKEDYPIYDWEDVQNASPDTIYGLSLAKMKLDTLPAKLSKFTHLRTLNLKKNKLAVLPDFIAEFKKLETIVLEKNQLIYFPIVFCRMPELRNILIGSNYFETLPECISGIKHLEYLDLYDTPIRNLPLGLSELQSIQKIDLSGIKFSPEFQEGWLKRMPDVDWEFDPPCACMR
ncbi:MAG: hypothetical protein MK105_13040 [Crocinitomicaceae bacterium]|nr:hypothetical protein [Crocinitomicaceae bacterium]